MNYQLIAHRGYSAAAPENTLASFQAATEQAIWGVEFDVHLSADNVPVVIHDHTVDRTTNGTGKVAEKTIAQLQSLDAGSWFSPQFSQETIPTLEQVLALFSATSIYLLIEIKSSQFLDSENIKLLSELLKPWRDRCLVASFQHHLLSQFNQYAPQLTLAYAVSTIDQYSLEYAQTLSQKGGIILPHFSLILEQKSVTQTLINQGWKLIPWTVDDPTIAEKLLDLKITKIITNNLLQVQTT